MRKLGAFTLSPAARSELLRLGFGAGTGFGVSAALAHKDERLRMGALGAAADVGIMGAERIPDLIRYLKRVRA